MSDRGIGARIPRNEDARLLEGRGQFVADIRLPGTIDAAFVRSPIAHGRIRAVHAPKGAQVFTAADLTSVRPVRAISGLPGFKPSDFPALATGKVRFAGEPVAVALGATRAAAEDAAQTVELDLDELAPVVDLLKARAPGAALVHEEWGDNVYLETRTDIGDIAAAARQAAYTVTREYRMARQAMVPMEGRATLAVWDERSQELVVYLSTQVPHVMRTGIARTLGLDQRRVRIIAPDVGGGFGLKCYLETETIVVAWLALKLGRPVRWIQDRREHLVADANCREHWYKIIAYADAGGALLGMDAEVIVDAGAYSVWPWTACLEAAMAGGNLPGPYHMKHYRAHTLTVATNKPGLVPYRGVARPGVCFAGELTIDALAREIGREAHEFRAANMVGPGEMPFKNIAGKLFDSGDYPQSVRRAAQMIDVPTIRARQKKVEPDGRLIGVGFASFTEQSAHGTEVFSAWGVEIVPGFELATARLTPDGDLVVEVAIQSHGQGLETTLAQVACTELGIDPTRVTVRHGDTALTPYGVGTFASRSMVMAGGAVARATQKLRARAAKIAAHLLQCKIEEVRFRDGRIQGPGGDIGFAEIGRAWYLHPEELPPDVDPDGLEVTAGYKPKVGSGAFSYSTHGALVAVDPALGAVEILDYVVIEDCGTMVNPMVVDGQIVGGAAQGIGTALYEESLYDESGQPLTSTFMDYIVPGPTEIPRIRIGHMLTPSPFTEHGIKGMGEGGAIAPPAAIANAINDALKHLGAEVGATPFTPRRVRAAIERAAQR